MIATSLADIAAVAPWAFTLGAVIGFFVGARFTIIKRNGSNGHD